MKFLDEIGLSHFITKLKGMFNSKVDKVSGKQLSTEDYSTIEKNKLIGIEIGANKYTHPDTHPSSIITGLPTSLPANGGTSTYTNHLQIIDNRNVVETPIDILNKRIKSMSFNFKSRVAVGNPPVSISGSGSYIYVLTIVGWTDRTGGYPIQVAYGQKNMGIRSGINDTTWSEWKVFSDDSSISLYHKATTPDADTSKMWLDTSI